MSNAGDRIVAAIGRLGRNHDIGIIWQFDDRKCNATSGPNALAGFPFADGEAEHLDRVEAIAAALEALADASEAQANA